MDPMKDIVRRVMEQMSRPLLLGDIAGGWERISGDKYSKATGFKDGCLTVSAQNSLCLIRLNLNREKLLQALQKEFPSIVKINFKVENR
ncbi:MAG: DUF721 domain-containing protein [Candidatus Omnitrophica bacterium]|nr:DUF721 domain-containing protein [Candidatus Omnitrophota bacterium]MDE2214578.1 DUF721 domain-containing protein [Candidatus Omnitrophota bacterium]